MNTSPPNQDFGPHGYDNPGMHQPVPSGQVPPGQAAHPYGPGAGAFPNYPSNRNIPGRIALTLGIILVISQAIEPLIYIRMLRTSAMTFEYDAVFWFGLITMIIHIGLGLAAVVTGLIGLRGRARPRGTAAAGLALGAAAIVLAVSGTLSSEMPFWSVLPSP